MCMTSIRPQLPAISIDCVCSWLDVQGFVAFPLMNDIMMCADHSIMMYGKLACSSW